MKEKWVAGFGEGRELLQCGGDYSSKKDAKKAARECEKRSGTYHWIIEVRGAPKEA